MMSAWLIALLAGGGGIGALWAWMTWQRRKYQKALRAELEHRRILLAADLQRLDDRQVELAAQDDLHGEAATEAQLEANLARTQANMKIMEIDEVDRELKELAAKYPKRRRKAAAGAGILAASIFASGAAWGQPRDIEPGEICETLEETSLEGLAQALEDLGPGIGADGARGLRLEESKIAKLCGALAARTTEARELRTESDNLKAQLVDRAALLQVQTDRAARLQTELDAQLELVDQLRTGPGIRWGFAICGGPRLTEDDFSGKRWELDAVAGLGIVIPFN